MQTLREMADELELTPEQLREPITKHLMIVPDNYRNPGARLFRAVAALLEPSNDYEHAHNELAAAVYKFEHADEEPTDGS